MLLRLVYALVLLPLLWLGVWSAALCLPKVRAGMLARRRSWAGLEAAAGRRDGAKPLVWVHCASAGEFLQAEPILRRLREGGAQVAVSLSSVSGLPWLERVGGWPELIWGGLLPLDFPWKTRRMLAALRPHAIVYVQADLWAGLVWAAEAQGVPQVLIAARTGKGRNYRAHPLLRWFFRRLYAPMAAILCLTGQDREGIARIVPGHAQLEAAGDPGIETVLARLAEASPPEAVMAWAGAQNPVLVAGSTWPADEQALLPALATAFAKHPELRAVIAPHEPTETALRILEEQLAAGFAGHATPESVRLSALESGTVESGRDAPDARVLLVDSVGRLASLYGLAAVAYVGGGFTSGVHNVAEPAACGAPVLHGPLHRNSAMAGLLLEAGAAQAVDSPEHLTAALLAWLENDDRRARLGAQGRKLVEAQAGAAQRCYDVIVETVPGLKTIEFKMPYNEAVFLEWQSPEEILEKAIACQNSMNSADFFNRSGIEFVRDARTAGEFTELFAQGKECVVRLRQPPDIDFEILIADEFFRFESIIVDGPGRKIGEEYVKRALQGQPLEKHIDPDEEEKLADVAITSALNKKLSKNYSPPPHLLLRMNMSYRREISHLKELTAVGRDNFKSIWLMSTNTLIQTWPEGQIVERPRSN